MLFIVNPIAGNGGALDKIPLIKSFLKENGIHAEFVNTQYVKHATLIAQENLEQDCIVAVGGDGTVREVATALINKNTAMGIIACGTGNDLCKTLCIPTDTQKALETLIRGETKLVDTLSVDGQVIINAAGIGFDVDVVRNTIKYKKRFKGMLAYIFGVVETLFTAKKFAIKVLADGQEFESMTLITEVANGSTIGGGMKVAPDAVIDDGLMDVCSAGDLPLILLPFLLPKFIKGTHIKLKYVRYFKTGKVSIATNLPVNAQLDGELTTLNDLNFEMHHKSLRVTV